MAWILARHSTTVLATVAVLAANQSVAAAGLNRAKVQRDTMAESAPQLRLDSDRPGAAGAWPDLTFRGMPLDHLIGPWSTGIVGLVDSTHARAGLRGDGSEPAYGKRGSSTSPRRRSVLRTALIGAAIGAVAGIVYMEALCRNAGGRNCVNGRGHTRFGGVLGLAGFGIGAAIGVR